MAVPGCDEQSSVFDAVNLHPWQTETCTVDPDLMQLHATVLPFLSRFLTICLIFQRTNVNAYVSHLPMLFAAMTVLSEIKCKKGHVFAAWGPCPVLCCSQVVCAGNKEWDMTLTSLPAVCRL